MANARTLRPAVAAALVALALAFTAIAGGSPAEGQEACDPAYGCLSTTTTLAPAEIPTPECMVSASTATVGDRVTVTITNVPDGTTINLTLGGTTVATGTAGASAAAAGEVATAAVAGYSDVTMSFTVPELPAGNYTLVATGPAFQCQCLPSEGFQVLAAAQEQNPRSGGTGGTGAGSLARTGFTVFGFLLAAAVLIVLGRMLLERSRNSSTA